MAKDTLVAGGAMDRMSSEERLAWAKDQIKHLDSSLGSLMEQQEELDQVRRCSWPGQDTSGRKLSEKLGKAAFPFEGASDLRVRLADQVVNEKVMLLVVSALRSEINVRGMESGDDALSARLSTLLRYVLRNELGLEYIYTLARLAAYREGDSPAAALAGVYWEKEHAVRLTELALEQLEKELLTTAVTNGMGEREAVQLTRDLRELLAAGSALEEAEQLVEQALPGVSKKRRRAAVRELSKKLQKGDPNPTCMVPERYVKRNGVRLEAHRVLQDVFVPTGMREFQRTPYYVISEWLAEYEVRERETSRGYSKSFVEALLERGDGEDSPVGALEGIGKLTPRATDAEGSVVELQQEQLKGLYQVLTVIYREVDEDGIPGVFQMAFSDGVDEPAHKPRVLDLPHGGYPGVWLQREVQSQLALDSRGWPELLCATQAQLKVMGDGVSNHAQLTTIPTLLTKGRRSTAALKLGPLAEMPLQANGSVTPLDLGDYPTAATNQQTELGRQSSEYAGRHADGVDPRLAQLHDEFGITTWTGQLREIFMQIVALYQRKATPEELQRIVGGDARQLIQSREDIQGRFDLDVVFDARNMDMDYLKAKAQLFNEFLKPLDMRGRIKWDVIVGSMLMAFDPNLAETALESTQSASRREIEEEEANFVKLAAGVEPEMAEGGQDFALRLKTLQGIVEKNPATLEKLDPMSQEMLQKRVQHLQHMVQQNENAQTGRVGAEKVTG